MVDPGFIILGLFVDQSEDKNEKEGRITMTEDLHKTADRLQLWEKAEAYAILCLKNYITESMTLDFPMLSGVTIGDFGLKRKSQSLVFRNENGECAIFRTCLDIELDKEDCTVSGYYLFDTDAEGGFVDEWLVLR